VSRVQGGYYPEKIWKTFVDAALAGTPHQDWPAAPATTRPAMRLYLPGEECLGKLVSGVLPGAPTTPTTPPVPELDPETGQPVETTTTTAPAPVIQAIDSGTTIAPDVVDPNAPLNTVDTKTLVFNCERGLASVVTTTTAAGG